MKHADDLIQRILFLEGLPNLQDLGQLRIGENPKEALECDLALELDAIPMYRDAVTRCEELRDYPSRDLLQGILDDEEEHVDWLETQLDLMDRIGVENYLQGQMHDDD
jgi:bacterioferritin